MSQTNNPFRLESSRNRISFSFYLRWDVCKSLNLTHVQELPAFTPIAYCANCLMLCYSFNVFLCNELKNSKSWCTPTMFIHTIHFSFHWKEHTHTQACSFNRMFLQYKEITPAVMYKTSGVYSVIIKIKRAACFLKKIIIIKKKHLLYIQHLFLGFSALQRHSLDSISTCRKYMEYFALTLFTDCWLAQVHACFATQEHEYCLSKYTLMAETKLKKNSLYKGMQGILDFMSAWCVMWQPPIHNVFQRKIAILKPVYHNCYTVIKLGASKQTRNLSFGNKGKMFRFIVYYIV